MSENDKENNDNCGKRDKPGKVIDIAAQTEAPTPLPATPVCPWCGTDPVPITALPFKIGPLHVLLAFCAACRKTLALLPLGMEENLVQPAGQAGRGGLVM